MKRIFLMLVTAVMTTGVLSAQDINAVTEIYNNGAMELQMGNLEAALNYFQEALTAAEALGDEGADIVANCQGTIPAINFEIAKDLIKGKQYEAAVTQLNKSIEVANLYGDVMTAEKATEMIPQVYANEANDLLKAKDAAGAIVAFEKSIALDSTNAGVALTLGRAYIALQKEEEAIKAFLLAARQGREKDAMKQLSTYYVKKAQASNKAQKYEEAIEYAAKSNSYLENANAYRFAAGASHKIGKIAESISYYEKFLELSPNAKDANGVTFTIAALYQQTGNKEKAKEYYQKVLTDPTYGADAQAQMKALN